jgi:hypothetical protein
MMANLMRTAKSGSRWSLGELHAYNIVFKWQDAATFFGVKPLPQPAVARELLKNVAANDMKDDANYRLLRYADMAEHSAPGEDSAVVDFAAQLLTLLGYVAPRTRIVLKRADIPLSICGQNRCAKADVCIVDSDDSFLLLLQADKQHKKPKDPQPQLIAGAIAAFQRNNDRREILNEDPIIHKVIPGITLTGTSPIFYKIPVTTQLAQCVELGLYPAKPTIVHAHHPKIFRPACCLSEGIEPLDNRATILSCFEAFKRFVN